MYPATIDGYERPTTIEEAVAAIGRGEDAMAIAGGQSLMQAIKARLVQPGTLVDLQDVAELKGVTIGADAVTIGAMTRYVELAGEGRLAPDHAAVSDAATHVGDRQVRNRGTIGGSLCWNYLAACMPAVALGLGAVLNLRSASGSRSLPADEFFGTPLETARGEDELLVSISLPAMAAGGGAGSAYRKWSLVSDGLPVIGACASVRLDSGGAVAGARLAFGGLETGPKRSPAGEAALAGCRGADDADSIAAAVAAAADEVETQDDLWADADYRRQLIRSLGAEVVGAALARAAGAEPSAPALHEIRGTAP